LFIYIILYYVEPLSLTIEHF